MGFNSAFKGLNLPGFYVSYQIACYDFNGIWIFYADFRKIPGIKFHLNSSNRSRADARRHTGGHVEATRRFSMTVLERLRIGVLPWIGI